jgi:hypothetical protein
MPFDATVRLGARRHALASVSARKAISQGGTILIVPLPVGRALELGSDVTVRSSSYKHASVSYALAVIVLYATIMLHARVSSGAIQILELPVGWAFELVHCRPRQPWRSRCSPASVAMLVMYTAILLDASGQEPSTSIANPIATVTVIAYGLSWTIDVLPRPMVWAIKRTACG